MLLIHKIGKTQRNSGTALPKGIYDIVKSSLDARSTIQIMLAKRKENSATQRNAVTYGWVARIRMMM